MKVNLRRQKNPSKYIRKKYNQIDGAAIILLTAAF